jgi:hypothetical protein
MPTAPSYSPSSALRRRLAAQRPGRPTAIAGAIAIAFAATGLGAPSPHDGTAAGGPPGAARRVAEPPSGTAPAHSGFVIKQR